MKWNDINKIEYNKAVDILGAPNWNVHMNLRGNGNEQNTQI